MPRPHQPDSELLREGIPAKETSRPIWGQGHAGGYFPGGSREEENCVQGHTNLLFHPARHCLTE